ncbi:MAG TPA: family 1 glycosylhydrolase [Ktedonobacterales bacterium]|nr:family 1 glycosylhydrolase [Ktedonobacterales bacterium]
MAQGPGGSPPIMVDRLSFPAGFRWGVATAAYQNEGGNTNSQWYEWELAGHIRAGDGCGLACDWWAHAERDFDRAQAMGLNALRLSVEWSRIEPTEGIWDPAPIARYRQMLRGLLERGIEPMVTLHHFTNPIWFERRGAFLSREAARLFARFAAHIAEELGDLCDLWCTVNEPNVYSIFGYELGDYPPGRTHDLSATARAQAGMAHAHAAAYRALHAVQPAARVGWAQHYDVLDPARKHSRLDRIVAHIQDMVFNDFFTDAVRVGRCGLPVSLFVDDLSDVRGTCDFVGINVYSRHIVKFDLSNPAELFGTRSVAPDAPIGDPGINSPIGEIYPQGIARMALRAAGLGKPVYVTESGVADAADGLRPWVIARATASSHEAHMAGIDLRGYYHWTLVDNFEWTQGWTQCFGLIGMDHTTQRRIARRSAEFYSAIARANALTREMVEQYAPSALAAVFPGG